MATFDITVSSRSAVGETRSGSDAITTPGDFDGATVTDVSVVGTPTITSDLPSDDTLGIRWRVVDASIGDTWGSVSSNAASLCEATLGGTVPNSFDTIVDGSATSPQETPAVAADWDTLRWQSNYTSNMMADAEECSWESFTIRVTYTPLPPSDVQQEHYRFCTPITGLAHEAYTLVGSEDTSFEITLDEDYCLIIKIGNDSTITPNIAWQLEYKVDSGSFTAVNGSSSNVRVADSGDGDDAFSVAERLTTSARAFVSTQLDEVDGALTIAIADDTEWELYYAITFRSADLSGGETITFRLTSSETVTYDITPTATVPVAGNTLAFGTITITGDLDSLGEHTGITGTITATGDLVGTGLSLEFALGTITITGDLVSLGEHTGVTGIIISTGDLGSLGEHTGVTGTILITGDLAGIGQNIVLALGTSISTGELDAVGASNTFGVINFIGELIAGGGSSLASGTSTFSATLAAVGTTNARGTITMLGEGLSEGTHLAAGTSTITGDLVSLGEHTGITGTSTFSATLTAVGTDLSAGFEESSSGVAFGSAQHKLAIIPIRSVLQGALLDVAITTAAGTITVTAELTADGIHLAQGTSTITGDLDAVGTTNARGTITILGEGLSEATHLAKGAITITGDLVALGEHTGITGTSTITGDLAAIGIDLSDETKFAAGTSTVTGDLAAVGTNNASGTITVLGVGLSEGTHLAAGTITITGDLAGVAISRQSAIGTISFIFEGVASGTHLAGGTLTFSGQVAAIGTGGSGEDIPAGKSIFQSEVSLPNDQSMISVGIQAFPGAPVVRGTIRIIGSLTAQTGNVQVSATITVIGALISKAPHDLFNIGSVSIFTDEIPTAPAYVWLHSGPPPSKNATGTISIIGDLSVADDITQFAFGTITVLGDVISIAEGVVNAAGTITVTGNLAGVGGKTLITVTATITIFGLASSVSGLIQESATFLINGQLNSIGTSLTPETFASGTITASFKLEAIPSVFCPITVSGTITLLGNLVALEDATDDIVIVSGSIQVSASLQSSLYHFKAGGNHLARGTITIRLISRSYFREVTCITPTATILMSGATLSAGFTDSNLFRKFATFTITGSLGVSAIYARASQLSISGELTALGRNLPFGHLAMLSDEADMNTSGQIGAGTIDGNKRSLIREDFGSIELYNNSQGGFYSIGGVGSLKEIFGLINFVVDMNAIGTRDQTVFGIGLINLIGSLAAIGENSLVRGTINVIGSMNGGGGTQFASASISVSADVSAVGTIATTWNISDANITDINFDGTGPSEASWRLETDGFTYSKRLALAGAGFFKFNEATDWIIPHEASGNPGPPPPIKVRATKLSGSNPTGPRALNVWHSTAFRIEWLLFTATDTGSNSCQLLIELSHDDGATIETSGTITLNSESFNEPGF